MINEFNSTKYFVFQSLTRLRISVKLVSKAGAVSSPQDLQTCLALLICKASSGTAEKLTVSKDSTLLIKALIFDKLAETFASKTVVIKLPFIYL